MGRGRAPRTNWQNIPRENVEWEEYYRTLNLPSAEPTDFDRFKKAAQEELPVTFRLTGSSKDMVEVREMMEEKHISKLGTQEWEGKPLEPPTPLSFYPNRLAWQVNVGKQAVRRNPQFSEFQRFLVVETNAGNISRQELVSMIPPLFLGVEPHHIVLDTCASPGSKTTQLIEALHQNTGHSADSKGVVVPSGLIIANDSDYKRSHMLTHQIKRLNSPNIIVTNHDAQMYPKIWLGSSYLKFDRILCDVPCTGDGTMRKNINVWKDWKVSNGQGLHQLQLNIATRSVHLLKQGGRLVYSTCSLNPTEDEAVVAQLLRQFPNLRLIDVSDQLPTLKRRPGVTTWKVQEKKTKQWYDLADYEEGRIPQNEKSDAQKSPNKGLPRSWFSPSKTENESFNLERCVRVYPEQQNSGGFFIAVLELTGPSVEIKDLEAKAEAKIKADSCVEEGGESVRETNATSQKQTDDASGAAEARDTTELNQANKRKAETELDARPAKAPKLPRDIPAFEEPFKFLSPDHPELLSCVKFYGIKPEFKMDTLVVRNAQAEPSRTIYYVAPSLKPVLENNDQKLKVIHAGIKLFNAQRNDGECKWRVQIEGITMFNDFATKRIVTTEKLETLKELCLETFIRLDTMKDLDPELHSQVEPLTEGCCIWRLNGSIYPLWRGKASVNLMAPKENTEELLLRLFQIDKKMLLAESAVEKQESLDETK